MKVTLILSILLVSALCANSIHNQLFRDIYSQWKLAHKKSYHTSFENELRFNIFVQNYIEILSINQQQSDVVLGLNQFADLTDEEYSQKFTHFKPKTNAKVADFHVNDLPDRIDWREKGGVTPVKDQGMCGSSWAFAAVGALEGLNFLNTGKLLTLSEQYVVDCSTKNQGCCGGDMDLTFEFTAQQGIELDADYPYTATQNKCSADPSKAIRVNSNYADVKPKDSNALKAALAAQPVALAVQADQAVFRYYKAGVIVGLCGGDVNHGIFAVGYDTYAGVEAFILKNSFGETWGRNGYVLVSTNGSANNGNGVCGVLVIPSVPMK